MTDRVKTNMGMTFRPSCVPEEATLLLPVAPRGSGFLPTLPLEELETDALDALVEQWLADIYGIAGRPSPFTMSLAKGGDNE